jgi:predicted TIM-barrel fold metal-dependent hydrolase
MEQQAKPQDIKAIDVMNYMFTPEVVAPLNEGYEIKLMTEMLFGGKGAGMFDGGMSPETFVAKMDEAGIEKTIVTALKLWSYHDHKLMWDIPIKSVAELCKKYPDRFEGRASYNPFRIMESLEEIERSVKEYGFKGGVYVHSLSYGVFPTDRRMYPCYTKCIELGIPFSLQVGHSLEALPSEPGRPMHMDHVILDFPQLVVILSHTGWPWCEEAISLASKNANVYIDISAHMPVYLDKKIVEFMNGRGRKKTLFGTNGLPAKDFKDQFMQLGMKEATNQAVLRDNAMKVFKL